MISWVDASLSCPRCGHEVARTVPDWIDISDDASLQAFLSLPALIRCPGCASGIDASTALVLVDSTHHLCVSVAPTVEARIAALAAHANLPDDARILCKSWMTVKYMLVRERKFPPSLVAVIPREEVSIVIGTSVGEDDYEALADAGDGHGVWSVDALLNAEYESAVQRGHYIQVSLRSLIGMLEIIRGGKNEEMNSRIDAQAPFLQRLVIEPFERWSGILNENIQTIERFAIHFCLRQIEELKNEGRRDNLLRLSTMAAWLSLRIGTYFEQGESVYWLAIANDGAGRSEEAARHFEAALGFYLEARCGRQSLECYKYLGDIELMRKGDPAMAERWYLEGLSVARELRLESETSGLLANLAQALYRRGELPQARENAAKALELAHGPDEWMLTVSMLDLDVLIAEQEGMHDEAADKAERLVDMLVERGAWAMYGDMIGRILKPFVSTRQYQRASQMMEPLLRHRAVFAPDFRSNGDGQTDETDQAARSDLALFVQGAIIADAAQDVDACLERFETAEKFASVTRDDALKSDFHHEWALALVTAEDWTKADEQQRASLALTSDAKLGAQRSIVFGTQLQNAARHLLSQSSMRESQNHLMQSAVDWIEAGNADLIALGASKDEIHDGSWLLVSALTLHAWALRREHNGAGLSIKVAERAVEEARRNGNSVCLIEALEVLYMSQRDVEQVQRAADTLLTIATLLIPLLRQPADKTRENLRRWVINNGRLPGVHVHLDPTGERITQPPPADKTYPALWIGLVLRLPAIGILCLYENRHIVGMEIVRGLAEELTAFMSVSSLVRYEGKAAEWHMNEMAKRKSLKGAPEQWVDRLAHGYFLIAWAADRKPEEQNAEWLDLVRTGYRFATLSLMALGLTQRALSHALRPPGMAQGTCPASELVPQERVCADQFIMWAFSASLAFAAGENALGYAISATAVAWAEAHEDWAQVLELRITISVALMLEGRIAEAKAEHAACVELIERFEGGHFGSLSGLPSSERERLSDVARFLETRDLARDEREWIRMELPGSMPEGEDMLERAERLFELARMRSKMGRGHDAESAAAEATALSSALRLHDVERHALDNKAERAFARGEISEAILLMEKVVSSMQALVEPDPSELARVLGLLGCYRNTRIQCEPLRFGDAANVSEELDRAFANLQESLHLHTGLGRRQDILVNNINLGVTFMLMGNITDSIGSFLKAAELCATFVPGAQPDIPYPKSCLRVWVNLASSCAMQDWFPEAAVIARWCLKRTGALLSQLMANESRLNLLPEQDLLDNFLVGIIWMWIVREQAGTAHDDVAHLQENRVDFAIRDELRAMCVRYGIEFDPLMYPLTPGPTSGSRQAADALCRELFEFVEDSKARIMRKEFGGIHPPLNAIPADLVAQEAEARSRWAQCAAMCQGGQLDAQSLDSAFRAYRESFHVLQTVWARLESWGGPAAEFARLKSGASAGFAQVRRCLGEAPATSGEAENVLIEFYFTNVNLLCLIIVQGAGKVEVDALPLSAMLTEERLAAIRDTTASMNLDQFDWRELDDVLAPVAQVIARWTRPGDVIRIVPHGVLHGLPLHALTVDKQPLIDRNAVCFLPSASAMIYCDAKRTGQRASVAVFADSLGDLANARVEARLVASLWHTRAIVGGEVNAVSLRKVLAYDPPPDLIHIACHIAFDHADPMQSGVLVANPDDTEAAGYAREDADCLSAREIIELSLKCDLVTLSGCESGVSRRYIGDELFGLTRAWLYAGTPSVVVSLWPVDDVSTGLLMERFYLELRGVTAQTDAQPRSKAQALARAQMFVRSLTAADAIGLLRDRIHSALDVGDGWTRCKLLCGIAQLQIDAGDTRAATDTYREASTVPLEDLAEHSQMTRTIRIGMIATASLSKSDSVDNVNYAVQPYSSPFHWASFALVGDPR
jgi:CHAT domain-containing protein/tetratricopeptide (TPR) repeat protein